MVDLETRSRKRRGRAAAQRGGGPTRAVDYRNLKNPFPAMPAFSEGEIADMHDAALRLLEELGMRVCSGGAQVDEATGMVRIGREIVAAARASAPRSIHCRAGARDRDVLLELGRLNFQPGAGAPHATDLERGRRPGRMEDFRELIRLTHAFDVLQMMPPVSSRRACRPICATTPRWSAS